MAVSNTGGWDLRIRASYGLDGAVQGAAPAGAVLRVVDGPVTDGGGNGWYKIDYDGLAGYARASYLTATDAALSERPGAAPVAAAPATAPAAAASTSRPAAFAAGARVAVSGTGGWPLRLRAAHGPDGAIQGAAPEGAVLRVLDGPVSDGEGNAWYRVDYDGLAGYARASYLAPSDAALSERASAAPAAPAAAPAAPKQAAGPAAGTHVEVIGTGGWDVRLRASGGPDGATLGAAPEGAVLRVLDGPVRDGDGNAWYRVDYDGLAGFVRASYLALTNAALERARERRARSRPPGRGPRPRPHRRPSGNPRPSPPARGSRSATPAAGISASAPVPARTVRCRAPPGGRGPPRPRRPRERRRRQCLVPRGVRRTQRLRPRQLPGLDQRRPRAPQRARPRRAPRHRRRSRARAGPGRAATATGARASPPRPRRHRHRRPRRRPRRRADPDPGAPAPPRGVVPASAPAPPPPPPTPTPRPPAPTPTPPPAAPARATGNFLWPAKGTFTQGFGENPASYGPGGHDGIDIANAQGTPLVAADAGTVIFAGWRGGLGNAVGIDHGNGFVTWYGHASSLGVSVGQRVARGETIAAMRSTGRSTGPHVHFSIVRNGAYVDPLAYLPR